MALTDPDLPVVAVENSHVPPGSEAHRTREQRHGSTDDGHHLRVGRAASGQRCHVNLQPPKRLRSQLRPSKGAAHALRLFLRKSCDNDTRSNLSTTVDQTALTIGKRGVKQRNSQPQGKSLDGLR